MALDHNLQLLDPAAALARTAVLRLLEGENAPHLIVLREDPVQLVVVELSRVGPEVQLREILARIVRLNLTAVLHLAPLPHSIRERQSETTPDHLLAPCLLPVGVTCQQHQGREADDILSTRYRRHQLHPENMPLRGMTADNDGTLLPFPLPPPPLPRSPPPKGSRYGRQWSLSPSR